MLSGKTIGWIAVGVVLLALILVGRWKKKQKPA